MFFVILVWASYQDWRQRSISQKSLWISGVLGMGVSAALQRPFMEMILSSGLGLLLLILSKCTNGGIGEGDGWFFVVSGLYIDWQDNVQLFLSGLFLCFGVSLIFVAQESFVRQKKKHSLPFLTFLLPAGIERIVGFVRPLL